MQSYDSESGDDFASASEGEQDFASSPSTSTTQSKQNRRKSFRPSRNGPKEPASSAPNAQTPAPTSSLMHTQSHVQQVPIQHSSIDSSPIRPLGTINIQQSTSTREYAIPNEGQAVFEPQTPVLKSAHNLGQTQNFSSQQDYFGQPDATSSRTSPAMAHGTIPSQLPNHAQNSGVQQQQRGWGSFSSWINTAVSTVSEVIENPNVVVSKAQNISYVRSQRQGIRNVASEQIDRVYESLDPEYDYDRERQNPKQQFQQVQAAPLKQPLQPNIQSIPSSKPTSPHSNDISDLLGSSLKDDMFSNRQPSKVTPNMPPPPPQPAGALDPTHAKFGYNDESGIQEGDGWGEDDGWGDNWDDGKDLADSIVASPPTTAQTATSLSLTSVGKEQTNNASNELVLKVHHGMQGSKETTPRRDVKDLFGSNDLSSHRTSNDFIRPADALFSTLDFASNAIGSAVLGVHQKVTQSHANARKDSQFNLNRARTPEPVASMTLEKSWGIEESLPGHREPPEKTDRSMLLNPKLNVVGTGLGALESLGKKAAGAIADVRRAGHQAGNYGYPDSNDGPSSFKVPRNMTYAYLFEDAGGHTHMTTLSNVAQDSSNRSRALAANNQKILEMDQLYEVEQTLSVPSLNNTVGDNALDLLAGHKDFKSIIAMLEKMGVQGTTHLRQLRNCTRKLGTLVQDTVHAFEQEWHNHQSRASEKDFFAKAPIKFFFESRLLTIYFDGIRALTQYSDKACDQILRLGQSFRLKAVERIEENDPAVSGSLDNKPANEVAEVLLQFVSSLIVEAMFLVRTYDQTLDAVLRQAKAFTTPLDSLDWDDLLFGSKKLSLLLLEQDAPAAVGNIQSITLLIVEVLKFDLVVDATHGKITPTFTPRPVTQPSPQPQPRVQPSRPTPKYQLRSDTPSDVLKPPLPPLLNSAARPMTPPVSRSSTIQSASPTISAATLQRQTPNRLGMSAQANASTSSLSSPKMTFSRPQSPSPALIQQRPPSRARLGSNASETGVPPVTMFVPPPVPKPTSGIETTGFKATTPRPIRAKLPAPAPKPKLADEDFFSILNG
ncbi:hypothetical protein BG004_003656 [Podila humilis]|nr:hypothetical protein BG004_003656 [Podila humilis]